MTPLLSFKKEERLSGKTQVDRLFKDGVSFFLYPFKVYWLITPNTSGYPARVLVSVGKRALKRAVDRNRMKRRIREAYRQNKLGWYGFLDEKAQQCSLALIYTPGVQMEYIEIEKKIKLVIQRLIHEIESGMNNNTRYLSEH